MESASFYKFLDQDKLNNIKGGMFKNNSYSGYSSQVLKSGICKYFRRKLFDKFEYCVVDMMMFDKINKALLTNLFNRLRILVMEEIVYSELGPINQCIKLLENIETLDYETQMLRVIKFCRIAKTCKRARLISYINNHYRFFGKKENLKDIKLNKVIKYKKENDSEDLLKYGELFINYLEDQSFDAVNIFIIIFNNLDNYDCGRRYRRKEPIYLIFEILEDKFGKIDEITKNIYNFCKEMFYRKNMIERRAFGVWIVCIALSLGKIDYNISNIEIDNINLEDYFKNRSHMLINEDFVVKDYHVNKNHGMAKFGNVGSVVIDEDLSILGDLGEKYRQFYVDVKNGKVPNKKKKFKVKSNDSNDSNKSNESNDSNDSNDSNESKLKIVVKNNYDNSKLKAISFDKFQNIEVLEEGVCGLKVCCIKVDYKGNPYILKEMRKSFNYGKDYVMIDELKEKFGIKSMNMRRIKCDKFLDRVDKNKRTLVKNWKWVSGETYYCKMDLFENIGDIGKHKHFLEQDSVFKECLKIRLYDGLFCSSDNILRNILINSDGILLSIDEGNIYGKRKEIFNKNDWFLKSENKEKTLKYSLEIIESWDLENKIDLIENYLKKYGFSDKIEIMRERLKNFKEIVSKEIN